MALRSPSARTNASASSPSPGAGMRRQHGDQPEAVHPAQVDAAAAAPRTAPGRSRASEQAKGRRAATGPAGPGRSQWPRRSLRRPAVRERPPAVGRPDLRAVRRSSAVTLRISGNGCDRPARPGRAAGPARIRMAPRHLAGQGRDGRADHAHQRGQPERKPEAPSTHRITWMSAISDVRLCARSAPRYSSVSALRQRRQRKQFRIGAPCAA